MQIFRIFRDSFVRSSFTLIVSKELDFMNTLRLDKILMGDENKMG